MSYGIETQNQNGIIQFSTETAGLYVQIVRSSVSISGGSSSFPGSAIVNASTAINAVQSGLAQEDLFYCIRPSGSHNGLYAQVLSSLGGLKIYNASSSTETVHYCVFVKVSELTTPTSGYGINVFTETGGLKYTSEFSPLSVETVLTVDLSDHSNSASFTYDTSTGLGLPWALVTSGQGVAYQNGFSWEPTGGTTGIGEWQLNVIQWTSTQIRSVSKEYFDNNITLSTFYTRVGADYEEAKLVVLRGYDY